MQAAVESAFKIKSQIQQVCAEYGAIRNNIKNQQAWHWATIPGTVGPLTTAFESLDAVVSQNGFLSELLTSDLKTLKKKYSESMLIVNMNQVEPATGQHLAALVGEVRKTLAVHQVHQS